MATGILASRIMDNHPRSRSLRRLYSHSGAGSTAYPSSPSTTAISMATAPDMARHAGILHPALISKYKKTGQNLADAASATEFSSKRWVWCPDTITGYVGGWVVSEDDQKGTATVACVDDTTRVIQSDELSKMNPPKFDRVEDIADLTFLNEASVVHNLRERYIEEMAYTYSGPFLVAINPYRSLPIYGREAVQIYRSRRKEECPPHVFAVAEKAWQNMIGEREGQSISITGESGAGKTENTKKVIQYLTAIAAEASHSLPPSGSASSFESLDDQTRLITLQGVSKSKPVCTAVAEGRELENQIIQANPILEAFGNAQTVRNNNSSRFGKFVRIEFTPSGGIAGANIDWYLLEKSRVTARSEKERNFHIFYQLLKGAGRDLKRDLLLTGAPEEYAYLNQSGLSVEGVDDYEEWRSLLYALDIVGFSKQEQFDLFRVVATILHIGNIGVTGSGTEQAHIRGNSELEKVCHLLGLPLAEFSKALLRPQTKAGREWVTQSRTKKQVEDEMGALSKSLYEKCFGALVEHINKALDRPTTKSTFIGVLDIAGFEIFETNGFEQLCINYTNEKLQQFFNHHMFVLEQEEYARESIDWQFVNFGHDLQPTIDLIESSSPIGILSCLDEECIMPKASDATFTEKLNQVYKQSHRNSVGDVASGDVPTSSSKYTPSRFAMGFSVSHYAGKVEYRTDGWLDKNRDPLNANITSVLANSSNAYIAALFEEYREVDVADASVQGKTNNANRRVKKGAFRTVAQRHKEQLNALMTQLQGTQPHFVRCIVPNGHKKAGQVNIPLVLDQLRCNGVLEGIRIARLGYPNRLPFVEFKQRYEVLTPGIIPRGYMDGRKACQRITEALELDSAVFRVGLNKIFFKAGILADLEERRDELLYDIFTRLQAGCRKFVCMRRVRKQLNRDAAIRTIQRNARIYLDLKSWPWWMLYTKVRPLLAATRTDEALKRKEAELLLVQERAQRDVLEKARLEQLKNTLETERQRVEAALEQERALSSDKDLMVIRSQDREAALRDELAHMQCDLDTADSQLERALQAQATSETRYTELKIAFEDAAVQIARLEAKSSAFQSRDGRLATELDAARSEIENLTLARSNLTSQLETTKRKLNEQDEDAKRARQRLEGSYADLQGKIQILLREKDNRLIQLTDNEVLRRQLEQRLAELRMSLQTAAEQQSSKDGELVKLRKDLADSHLRQRKVSADASDMRLKYDAVSQQLTSTHNEVKRAAQQRAALEGEVDKLTVLLTTRSSEDAQQKELAMLKDQEILDMRSQVRALTYELDALTKSNAEKVSSIKSDLDTATRAADAGNAALGKAMHDLEDKISRLQDTEARLKQAEYTSRNSEIQFQDLQRRFAETSKLLAAASSDCNNVKRDAAASKRQILELEDRALQAERDRASWEQEMDTMGDRLEVEMTKRMQLEKKADTVQNDIDSLQLRIIEQDQYIKGLRSDLVERDAELAKAISLQDKTIVEHVHVLEEAKRYTDKQLADTQSRLASLTTYSRTLEKTKARLQAELEDLMVHNERERLDERSLEKAMHKLEDQAEKATKRLQQEERMRQVADADVVRLKAEVQKLKAQAAVPQTSGMVRSRSAFENVPPPGHEPQSPNSVPAAKRYERIIADLEQRDILAKDGHRDDNLRQRILEELHKANRELAGSMRATLGDITTIKPLSARK